MAGLGTATARDSRHRPALISSQCSVTIWTYAANSQAVFWSRAVRSGALRTPIETRRSSSRVEPDTTRSSTGLSGRPWNRTELGVASSPNSVIGSPISRLDSRTAHRDAPGRFPRRPTHTVLLLARFPVRHAPRL